LIYNNIQIISRSMSIKRYSAYCLFTIIASANYGSNKRSKNSLRISNLSKIIQKESLKILLHLQIITLHLHKMMLLCYFLHN
jgi:hypothetical protein